MKMKNEELAKERIETARKNLAKILNLLEGDTEYLRHVCENMEWNDEVVDQMENAAKLLGYSLATLTNWYDDDGKNFEENEKG